MQVGINNPVGQTYIFAFLFFVLLLSFKKVRGQTFLSLSLSQEMRGFAILAVVFSHIGFFLSTDPQFLSPFSILAGLGVNLFLVLSGFGITSSLLKSEQTPLNFYLKRIKRLFIPLWLVIIPLIILDWLVLHKTYSPTTIGQSLIGFFPSADIFSDLAPQLWYFTITLFYYLAIPWVFWRKYSYLSVLVLAALGYFLFPYIPLTESVLNLWELHFLAFPIGTLLALIAREPKVVSVIAKLKYPRLRYPALAILLVIFVYTAFNSGVSQGVRAEETLSLVTTFAVIGIFQLKPISFDLFSVFGKYSYEVYLFHWPLLYKYDIFYKILPAGVATFAYLGVFIVCAWALQKVVSLVKL